jgi:hypothetical protein
MSNLKKEEQMRREGMAYALRVAKERGIDGLEEELEKRNATEVPIRISTSQLKEFSQLVKHNVIFYMGVLTRGVLADKFDFDADQLKIFDENLNFRADCLTEDYTTWKDQIDTLNEDFNLGIKDEGIDTTIRI